TSFTRTSIYNYFETKEEIFLALFAQEYEYFSQELDRLCEQNETLTLDELASALAHALERRPLMLKLLSMNMYDMEANSRMERLVAFKTAYGASKDALDRCLKRFVPALDEKRRQTFLYAFLPFVYGLYPYTMVTEKQKQAMQEAGISYVYMSTYDMAYDFIRTLLGGLQ
ncbi:MAG: TetR/AcrR family transcriptional regulator, partial [Oscillospiraceae bacterium]|nr:TetR/AcrR family transcriptional regulator [Oscillospiraceae bacterium]